MKHLKSIIVILMLAVANAAAFALSFRVEAPQQVVVGQKFSVTFQLVNAPSTPAGNPAIPSIPNCKLLFGPGISQSSSYQNINGHESSSSTIGYTYSYKAEKAGTVTIGAAKMNVGGRSLSTKPIKLQILPPDRSAQRGTQSSVQAYDIDTQTADKPVSGKDVFIRIVLSKPTAYEQEGVLCSIKLYTKYQVSKFITNVQPAYNGFMAEEVPVTLQGRFESVGGENYFAYVIKQSVLFPQQTGKLTISSGSYDLTVQQFETINTSFGRMRSPVDKTIKVNSNTASINVMPLPSPRPADFSGAVGRFSVTRALTSKKIRTNEAATIKLIISGQGNLKSLTPPKFGFSSQFDQYDPQTAVTASPSGATLSGKVTVDYTFVPQSVGRFAIDGTSFTYFDLNSHQYRTIKVDGFNLNVEKGSASNAVKYNDAVMKDILPMENGSLDLSKSHGSIFGEWYTIVYYIVLLLAFAIVLFIYRKKVKERANVTLMKRKGANKVANRRLKRAKRYMNKNQKELFYEEMLTALWGYYSDKLSIPVSELNRDNISKNLDEYGLSQEAIGRVINILDECEFSRYAQSAESNVPMAEIYRMACDSIDEVENTKKKQQ